MTSPAYKASVSGDTWTVTIDGLPREYAQGRAMELSGAKVYLDDKSAYEVINGRFVRATTPLYDNFVDIKDKMMANKHRVIGAILLVFALIFTVIAATTEDKEVAALISTVIGATTEDKEVAMPVFAMLAVFSALGSAVSFLYKVRPDFRKH